MKLGTALVALIAAVPGLAVCGVCTYWTLTASGWWLIGTVLSACLFPTAHDRTSQLGDKILTDATVTL